jgi:hypothetical protein
MRKKETKRKESDKKKKREMMRKGTRGNGEKEEKDGEKVR